MNNIDALIKKSAEDSSTIKTPKDEGDPKILEYLKAEYPAEEYNADFCQYRYKWGNLYGVNFWKKIYKEGCNFPTNSLFRRMILKVTLTPDGPLVEVDTDEGRI